MSENLDWFNGLPGDEAERYLLACCGSRSWAMAVAAQRPYSDVPALMDASDEVGADLSTSDWLEAFAAHPRVGESGGHSCHSIPINQRPPAGR